MRANFDTVLFALAHGVLHDDRVACVTAAGDVGVVD